MEPLNSLVVAVPNRQDHCAGNFSLCNFGSTVSPFVGCCDTVHPSTPDCSWSMSTGRPNWHHIHYSPAERQDYCDILPVSLRENEYTRNLQSRGGNRWIPVEGHVEVVFERFPPPIGIAVATAPVQLGPKHEKIIRNKTVK